MELAKQVWPEVDETSLLLVPLGSTEQHGPHLPFDTDARIAEAIATNAASQMMHVSVAPVLPYGASGEHAGFAGTLSIGSEVLKAVIIELTRSAMLTFGRVVFVNGHGGNHGGMRAAIAQMQSEGHDVASWSPSIPGGDAHAGRTETSLMLAIAPESVRIGAAEAGNTAPLSEILDELRAGGVVAASPNGVLGDPAGASVEEGQQLLAQLVADLRSALA